MTMITFKLSSFFLSTVFVVLIDLRPYTPFAVSARSFDSPIQFPINEKRTTSDRTPVTCDGTVVGYLESCKKAATWMVKHQEPECVCGACYVYTYLDGVPTPPKYSTATEFREAVQVILENGGVCTTPNPPRQFRTNGRITPDDSMDMIVGWDADANPEGTECANPHVKS